MKEAVKMNDCEISEGNQCRTRKVVTVDDCEGSRRNKCKFKREEQNNSEISGRSECIRKQVKQVKQVVENNVK